MSKEIAIFSNQDIKDMAKSLGPLFGKQPQDLYALMLIAQAQNIHPARAAQDYDIIQGKPAINSKAALSRFQEHGGSIQWITRTDVEASAKFSHPQGGELTVTWTMDRAKQAQLTGKANWQKYPAQMLSARVIAEGVRAVYPACLNGMYTDHEVRDFDVPQRNVTAQELRQEPSDDYVQTSEESKIEKVKQVFEGEEITPEGEMLFPDDEVEPDYDTALKHFRSVVEKEPYAEMKTFIIDLVSIQNNDAKAKACELLHNATTGDTSGKKLTAYIDLYMMNPAVRLATSPDGTDMETIADNVVKSGKVEELLQTFIEMYEIAKAAV